MRRTLTLELTWTVGGPNPTMRRLTRVLEEPLFIPRTGDFVELADGWSASPVTSVMLMADGNAYVRVAGGANLSEDADSELRSLRGLGWTGTFPEDR
jgi:hypothetical protein